MAVLTPVPTAAASVAVASGPACSLQRTGSLWQLGIEAQELTIAIGQLAEQLEADDDTRDQALAEQEGDELLITTDTNLRYQQNLGSRSIAILVLTATSWPRIRQVTGEIQAAVAAINEGDYREIPIP